MNTAAFAEIPGKIHNLSQRRLLSAQTSLTTKEIHATP